MHTIDIPFRKNLANKVSKFFSFCRKKNILGWNQHHKVMKSIKIWADGQSNWFNTKGTLKSIPNIKCAIQNHKISKTHSIHNTAVERLEVSNEDLWATRATAAVIYWLLETFAWYFFGFLCGSMQRHLGWNFNCVSLSK